MHVAQKIAKLHVRMVFNGNKGGSGLFNILESNKQLLPRMLPKISINVLNHVRISAAF